MLVLQGSVNFHVNLQECRVSSGSGGERRIQNLGAPAESEGLCKAKASKVLQHGAYIGVLNFFNCQVRCWVHSPCWDTQIVAGTGECRAPR